MLDGNLFLLEEFEQADHAARLVLYHISFRDNLAGRWQPRLPSGMSPGGKYPEPDFPRISFSSSLDGAFRGIFPNVSHLFEAEQYPYMLFTVYSPLLTGRERLLSPTELTEQKMVWDAHVTKEWVCLDTVEMRRVGQIKIRNTNSSPTLMVHPFNSEKYPKQSVGPTRIVVDVVSGSALRGHRSNV